MAFFRNISQDGSDDGALVERFRTTGDLEVLGTLYGRYLELVYGLCLKYLKDPERAKDAVMGLFEELVVKLPKHEVTHFRAWLFSVARNYCLMQLRSDKKFLIADAEPTDVQSDDFLHLMEGPESQWSLEQLDHCLKALSPDQRLMVEMFYLKERSYKEIAQQTGVDWNRVRTNIQNGRRNLRICLEKSKNESAFKS